MKERFLKLIANKRHLLIALALFLVSFSVFSFFWGNTVSAAPQKARAEYLSRSGSQSGLVEIGKNGVEQTVLFDKTIYALAAYVESESDAGILQLQVQNGKGEPLATVERELSERADDGLIAFSFVTPLASEDGRFILRFSSGSSEPIFLKTGDEVPDGWTLVADSKEVNQSVVLIAETERLGDFIRTFYWAFAVIGSLSIAFIYLLSKREKSIPIHRIYAVAAILLGLLFCFILPPYSSPDEQFHINEAFTISSGWMGEIPDTYRGGDQNVKRADDHNAVLEDLSTTVFSYKEFVGDLFSPSKDSSPVVYDGALVGGAKFLFWPGAIAVTIARLLGLGFATTLFLGRLANLACYVVLTSLSVKFAPVKKGVFAVSALLPMSMHLAASFNRDTLTIGLYFFFTAYILYLIMQKTEITVKNLAILLGISFLALPAKIVYAPLLLLILFLGNDKFVWKGKKVDPKYIRIAKYLAIGAGVVLFIIAAYPYIMKTFRPPVSEAVASHPDDIRYTTVYIISHLKETVWLILNTLFSNTTFYLNTLVGGKLGYFNIEIDWFFVLAFYALLGITFLPEKGERHLDRKQGSAGMVLALLASALVVFACINWTPTYFLTIYGIQGRYFLPLLPILLVSLGNRIRGIEKKRNLDYSLLFLSFSFSLFTLLNAFLVILER